MDYSELWGSKHPGHLVYLLDLSSSMGWDNGERINKMMKVLYSVSDYLIAKAAPKGVLKNEFSLTILGYNRSVTTLFEGDVIQLNNYLDSLSNPEAMFDVNTVAKPQFKTYTAEAFRAAKKDVEKWMDKQQAQGIPMPAPIVIHITDGRPEEQDKTVAESMAEARKAAEELKRLRVPDGNLLLFNIQILPGKPALLFPSTRPESDEDMQFIFDISSQLAESHLLAAKSFKMEVVKGARFMATGVTNEKELVRLILFGSMPSQTPPSQSSLDDTIA